MQTFHCIALCPFWRNQVVEDIARADAVPHANACEAKSKSGRHSRPNKRSTEGQVKVKESSNQSRDPRSTSPQDVLPGQPMESHCALLSTKGCVDTTGVTTIAVTRPSQATNAVTAKNDNQLSRLGMIYSISATASFTSAAYRRNQAISSCSGTMPVSGPCIDG